MTGRRMGEILAAVFLVMFTFGILCLLVLVGAAITGGEKLDGIVAGVFGTLASTGAGGFATLFYFLQKNPPPPPDDDVPPGWTRSTEEWLDLDPGERRQWREHGYLQQRTRHRAASPSYDEPEGWVSM